MPSETSRQCQALWIGIVTIAVADLCLFTPLSQSHKNFPKAVDFCTDASSSPNLMSVIGKECSITEEDVVMLLDILKANRGRYNS
ncbi:hypothetical protein BJV78DRAFT_1282757 [Lactifluus subvellereus]|nr:hypothetical protein BJV78DRAFT_1282757 [Lactifluus subvellereus]